LNDLCGLSGTEIAAWVRSGRTTASDVIAAHLSRIAARDDAIGAFISVAGDSAREAAAHVDRRVARGGDPGPLAGVPIAVKDNICTAGIRTTCASKMLAQHVPHYDATAIKRLKAAGAVVIGKTNLDEFGMGSSTETSAFGVTRNPWDRERVPGGSSGGSAAAVAAGMAPIALGSDTGGSVRQPGGFCGVPAFKPRYGAVSRNGLVAFASSLDQIGWFARTPDDLELVSRVVCGHDPLDATSRCDTPRRPEAPCESGTSPTPLRGRTIGLPRRLLRSGCDADVIHCLEAVGECAEALGARTVEIDIMDPGLAVAAYYVLASAEASANLARYDGIRYGPRAEGTDFVDAISAVRRAGFGLEVKRRILLGTYALSAGYHEAVYRRALGARALIRDDIDRAFDAVDVVLLPTSPTTAFRIGERIDDPLAMYLSDVFTISANLTGYPALSFPAGLSSDGLPIGLQLLGADDGEETILRIASCILDETGEHRRSPNRMDERGERDAG